VLPEFRKQPEKGHPVPVSQHLVGKNKSDLPVLQLLAVRRAVVKVKIDGAKQQQPPPAFQVGLLLKVLEVCLDLQPRKLHFGL